MFSKSLVNLCRQGLGSTKVLQNILCEFITIFNTHIFSRYCTFLFRVVILIPYHTVKVIIVIFIKYLPIIQYLLGLLISRSWKNYGNFILVTLQVKNIKIRWIAKIKLCMPNNIFRFIIIFNLEKYAVKIANYF